MTSSRQRRVRSGSSGVSSAGATSSVPLQRQSGPSDATSSLSSMPRSGSSRGASMSLTSRPQSGSGGSASTLTPMTQSGSNAAGNPAATLTRSSASAAGTVGSAGSVENSEGGSIEPRKSNPWNLFQKSLKGRGLTSTMMSSLYHLDRSGNT